MRTYKDAKAMAKSLRESLAARSVSLSHGECLEVVAKQFGFSDWNTLSAKLDAASKSREESRQRSRADAHERMTCSFCGKSQNEVRTLVEGGCRSRLPQLSARADIAVDDQQKPPCVFICDECVALCSQINADLVGSAKEA